MLRTVRLELARNPDYPEGSTDNGYEFRIPLDNEGHLDIAAWRHHRHDCSVRRFWRGEPDLHGELVHGHRGWAVSYRPGEEDDEQLFRLDRHRFQVGEYVSITAPDDESFTFRIAAIQ